MLSNGFHTLKRSVTRLALFAAVQVVFCLWFAVFCAGLVSLGPLRLPYDVPGYWYGGLACLSTAFLPVWVAWTCNEAIDAARKAAQPDASALTETLTKTLIRARKQLPRELPVIPLLLLLEWSRHRTLHAWPMAVVLGLLWLLDFAVLSWMERQLPCPEAEAAPSAGDPPPVYDPLYRQARQFLAAGILEALVLLPLILRFGFHFDMVGLEPRAVPNVLTLIICLGQAAGLIRCGRMIRRQLTVSGEAGPDLAALREQLRTHREQQMTQVLLAPLAVIIDLIQSESPLALLWLVLAVACYLVYEGLYRRFIRTLTVRLAEH